MKNIALIILLLALFSDHSLASEKPATDEIAVMVTQLAGMMRDAYAQEYENARGIHVEKLDDNTKIAVALFSIEGFTGGNGNTQFLAAFVSSEFEDKPSKFSLIDVTAVGGKGWREVDFKKKTIRAKNGKVLIHLDTLGYGTGDGLCCPSRKGATTYTFRPAVGGRLNEIGINGESSKSRK